METLHNDQDRLKSIRNGALTPERSGDYWSQEERETLCEEYEAGDGISTIALRHERSEMAVLQQLLNLGMLKAEKAVRRRNRRNGKCRCIGCPFNPGKSEQCNYCQKE